MFQIPQDIGCVLGQLSLKRGMNMNSSGLIIKYVIWEYPEFNTRVEWNNTISKSLMTNTKCQTQ